MYGLSSRFPTLSFRELPAFESLFDSSCFGSFVGDGRV